MEFQRSPGAAIRRPGTVLVAILVICGSLAVAPGLAGGQALEARGADAGAASASSDLAWNVTVGGPNRDSFAAVVESGDGGYVAAGSFGATRSGPGDAWLVKVDAGGNVVWNRTYATGQFRAVIPTDDGGYLAVGEQQREDIDSVALAVKVGADGSVEWSRTYGAPEDSGAFFDAAPTGDGGYVLMGTSFLGPQSFGNASNAYFVGVNGDGTVRWERGHGKPGSADSALSIHRTDGGNYAFFGSFGFATSKWAGSIDADGDLVRNRSIGIPDRFSATTDSVETASGYALVGHSGGIFQGDRIHFLTLEDDLDVATNATVPVVTNVTTKGMAATADGTYLVAAWNWSRTGENIAGGTVLEIGADGTKRSVRNYRSVLANDVVAVGDGDYVVVGVGPGEGGDGWIAATGTASGDERSVAEVIAGDDGVIDTSELSRAIRLWATGEAVPGTGGETVDTPTLQTLIRLWATGQPVGD